MIKKFKVNDTNLKDAFLVEPFLASDSRGHFIKDYSKDILNENGIHHNLEEVFYTISKKGVIRALHFQEKKPQAKLVRCISGSIYDVIVDLRKDSKTFGKWQGFYLNDKNNYQLLIPGEFAHGYLVLEDSIVSYKCDKAFHSEFDTGIKWDDMNLNIDWPLETVDGKIILSDKDQNLQSFEEFLKKGFYK